MSLHNPTSSHKDTGRSGLASPQRPSLHTPPQRSYLQMQPHTKGLGVIRSTYEFTGGHSSARHHWRTLLTDILNPASYPTSRAHEDQETETPARWFLLAPEQQTGPRRRPALCKDLTRGAALGAQNLSLRYGVSTQGEKRLPSPM